MGISQTTTKEKKLNTSAKKQKALKPDDAVYTYCYILSTPEQRKAVDLNKYKVKFEKTITSFFEDRLISLEVFSDHYLLKLKDKYETSEKRRLGRLISEQCDLSKYSRKILYNNSKDSSGQLFRICKDKDRLNDK